MAASGRRTLREILGLPVRVMWCGKCPRMSHVHGDTRRRCIRCGATLADITDRLADPRRANHAAAAWATVEAARMMGVSVEEADRRFMEAGL